MKEWLLWEVCVEEWLLWEVCVVGGVCVWRSGCCGRCVCEGVAVVGSIL